MDNKQNLEKEVDRMIHENKYDLDELAERERQVRRERDLILREKDVCIYYIYIYFRKMKKQLYSLKNIQLKKVVIIRL